MYTKYKYSDFILKLKGFKFESEYEKTITYKKTIVSKDEFNHYMEYYIYYIWHKKEKWADVCIASWTSSYGSRDRGYNWYTGDYEKQGQNIMKQLRKKGFKIKGLIYDDWEE